MKRIDKAIRPPGLIRSAKTYSLFFDKDCLYAIVAGPAGMKVGTIPMFGVFSGAASNLMKKPIENIFENKYAPKITEGEKRIDVTAISELAKEKYNLYLPFNTLTSVKVGTDAVQGPYLQLATKKEKIKFLFRDKTQAEVESIAKDFGHEINISK